MFISMLPLLSCCRRNKCEISKSTHIQDSAQAAGIQLHKTRPICAVSPGLRLQHERQGMQIELNWTSSQTEAGAWSQPLAVNSQSTPGKKGG